MPPHGALHAVARTPLLWSGPMHKLVTLAFLASLTLACDKGGTTGSGDGSTSGTGGATESGASNSNDSNATEVSGTDGATGDFPTTANSVTTPPMTDPTGQGPTSDPTGETQGETVTSANPTTADPTGDPTGDPDEAATQLCVDTINMYRGTLGLPPLARWFDAEVCSDGEAMMDGASGTPHGAFGQCGEFAQNECPGWPGPPEAMITGCLELMWNEGPGEDFNTHGHYINMSSTSYTKVACGFADGMNGVWSVQNFQ